MTAVEAELRPGVRVHSPIGDGRIVRWAFSGWEVMVANEVRWFAEGDLRPVDRSEEADRGE